MGSLDEAARVGPESIWWRDLKMALLHSHQSRVFQNRLKWKVGCGDRIKFWEDRWICGEETLAEKYPRLKVGQREQQQEVRRIAMRSYGE